MNALTKNLVRSTKMLFSDRGFDKEFKHGGESYRRRDDQSAVGARYNLKSFKELMNRRKEFWPLCYSIGLGYSRVYYINNLSSLCYKSEQLTLHINKVGMGLLPLIYYPVALMFLVEYLIENKRYETNERIELARKTIIHNHADSDIVFVYDMPLDSDDKISFIHENLHHYVAAVKWCKGELNPELMKDNAYKKVKEFYNIYRDSNSMTCDELFEIIEHDYELDCCVTTKDNENWKKISAVIEIGEVEVKPGIKMNKSSDKLLLKDTSSNLILSEPIGVNVLADYHTYGLEVPISSIDEIVDDMTKPIDVEEINNVQYEAEGKILINKDEKTETYNLIKSCRPNARISNFDLYFCTLVLLKLNTLLLCLGCLNPEKAKKQFICKSLSKIIHHRNVCAYLLKNLVTTDNYIQSIPMHYLNDFDIQNYVLCELNRRYHLPSKLAKCKDKTEEKAFLEHLVAESKRLDLVR